MVISPRMMTIVALAAVGLLASVMIPRDPSDIGGVEAAYPDAPPLHVSVPTVPYPPAVRAD